MAPGYAMLFEAKSMFKTSESLIVSDDAPLLQLIATATHVLGVQRSVGKDTGGSGVLWHINETQSFSQIIGKRWEVYGQRNLVKP